VILWLQRMGVVEKGLSLRSRDFVPVACRGVPIPHISEKATLSTANQGTTNPPMPPSRPPPPQPLQPTRQIFDPYNSSSSGHQRAENGHSGSTSWRDSRTHKLSHQLRDTTGRGGTQHLSDLIGAGSENFGLDGRKENGDWEKSAPGLREEGWRDIREMMQGTRKTSSEGNVTADSASEKVNIERDDGRRQITGDGLQYWQGRLSTDKTLVSTAKYNPNSKKARDVPSSTTAAAPEESTGLDPSTSCSPHKTLPQIFSGLNIYLNGSTLPHISDHKLKHLLAQYGANISIALGRRTVTHVILGDKGGLAAGKIQKEVAKTGGKGVKFVGVRWVLESIEKGKRQPESRYEVVRLALKGQRSVLEMGVRRSWNAERISNNDT
jgi:hypothetical protein